MNKKEKKELLILWSLLIKLRAGNKCEWCGRKNTLNSHHIYSKQNPLIAYDEDNGCCLCAGHHTLNRFSAHKSPIEFVEWLKEKRGEKWYIMLRAKAYPNGVYQKPDYKLIKLYLQQ